MKKNNINLLICLITLFVLAQFFINTELIINTFLKTSKFFLNNLFPSIFCFFIISDILNNYHFDKILTKLFGKIIKKIYKVPETSAYIIIMSMFSGFPGNGKLIKEQLDNKNINEYEANKLLCMTHFSNPIFIIYTIGIQIFHNKKIGFIILISHYITNFLTGLLFKNIYYLEEENIKKEEKIFLPFIQLLKKSITNTFNNIIPIYGIIIFFSLLTTIINNYLQINPFSLSIINGLLEISNGIFFIQNLSINPITLAIIITFFISFGGLSIHIQIMSLLSKYHINYYLYLLSRIIHASLSSIIVFLLLT